MNTSRYLIGNYLLDYLEGVSLLATCIVVAAAKLQLVYALLGSGESKLTFFLQFVPPLCYQDAHSHCANPSSRHCNTKQQCLIRKLQINGGRVRSHF